VSSENATSCTSTIKQENRAYFGESRSVNSSGVRVDKKHVVVDTSMRILWRISFLFGDDVYSLELECTRWGTNVLLHNLKLLWRLNLIKYSLSSCRVRWLNGE
jgi:hypothetical protein